MHLSSADEGANATEKNTNVFTFSNCLICAS